MYNLIDRILNFLFKNSIVGIEPITLAAIIAGASSLGGAAINKWGGSSYDPGGEPKFKYEQLPDYPEATGAREMLWGKVQDWGSQPGYGAISPEWNDIWNKARNRISQYYWGGVTDPGLAEKVKASAAGRNVATSPALETELTKMGMQEKQDINELAIDQALQEATFGEQGRQTWLDQVQGLTGLKPSYMTTGYQTQPSGTDWGSAVAGIGQSVAGGMQQAALMDYEDQQMEDLMRWMTKMTNMQSMQYGDPIGGYSGGGYSRLPTV